MAKATTPVKAREKRIREWFEGCDPKQTTVRDHLKRAAKLLWQRQTLAEQDAERTIEHNGRGYNGFDAEFASRITNWKGTLTERMAFGARKMLMKYARQLAEIAENER